ncbi:MAG: hypothetical protein H6812_11540 [Phycisphaeraceae bacterium]|nr:hypothetical protein [Phycisphaerales bacterium]MCB9843875.1 hypothetical protein [Phycisphaeraceae bacterium]
MSTMHVSPEKVLSKENIYLGDRSGGMLWAALSFVGLALIGVAVIGALAGDVMAKSVALYALHTGALIAMGFSIGAMVFVMLFRAVEAGWSISVRRQFENVMSLWWVGALLIVGVVILQMVLTRTSEGGHDAPYLWKWMNPAYTEGDTIYQAKAAYLSPLFFYIRLVVYFAIWGGLATGLWYYSTQQDLDGDKRHSLHARNLAYVGMVVGAFSLLFASTDLVMSLDYHWFSTMLPVWFFAGCLGSGIALVVLTLIVLRSMGRLHVLFTSEHQHDLSKLVFGFAVCFWAYIAFSQYMLIWYANIPEETAFFDIRKQPGTLWVIISWVLPIAHFILPFIFFLPRPIRRSSAGTAFVCVWLILVHIIDWWWMIRPNIHGSTGMHWIDVVGVAGPVLLFVGLLIRKVASGPLVPLRDPRMYEALEHKNYV